MDALKQMRNDVKKYIDRADDKVLKMVHAMLLIDADSHRLDVIPDHVRAGVDEALLPDDPDEVLSHGKFISTRDYEMVRTVIDLFEKEYNGGRCCK